MDIIDSKLFSELRSFMNRSSLLPNERSSLLLLLSKAYELNHQAYVDCWVPYIRQFPTHFADTFHECCSLRELQHHALLIPYPCLSLRLSASELSKTPLDEIVSDSALDSVVELSLGGVVIGSLGIKLVAASPFLANVRLLNFGGGSIGDIGVGYLAESELLANLQDLVLTDNGIGLDGLLSLRQASFLGRLRCLNLSNNMLGNKGASIVANLFTELHCVQELNLANCGIDTEGVAFLAVASSQFPSLISLNLSANSFGDSGVFTLCHSNKPLLLQDLWLDDTGISSDGVRYLANSPCFSNLRSLSLRSNDIGDAGLRSLSKSSHLVGLQNLYLSECGVGDEGVVALADSEMISSIECLHLYANLIGDEGAIALASSSLTCLQEVDLSMNQIGEDGIHAFAAIDVVAELIYNPGIVSLGRSPQSKNWNAGMLFVWPFVIFGLMLLVILFFAIGVERNF